MADYTHEYSKFPNELISKRAYKDVNDSVAAKINGIKALQAEGRYSEAAALIPDVKDYLLGADVINTLIEEIRNAQIYAKGAKQCIYVQSEEPDSTVIRENDVWIGG